MWTDARPVRTLTRLARKSSTVLFMRVFNWSYKPFSASIFAIADAIVRSPRRKYYRHEMPLRRPSPGRRNRNPGRATEIPPLQLPDSARRRQFFRKFSHPIALQLNQDGLSAVKLLRQH